MPHTGLHIVHRDGVGAVGMGDAADECKPIGHAGDFRNVLPELRSRHAGADRVERPANFLARIGLQVPDVLVGRSPEHEAEDARLGSTKRARGFLFGLFGPEQVREHQPHRGPPAGP